MQSLPAWQEGYMDLHHISTGRGNAAFIVLPDGTTLLIDAGDISETHLRTLSARNSALRPNAQKSAPEWIADYIRQFGPDRERQALDCAVITHYHDDHFGEWDSTRTLASNQAYALTGIMAVGDLVPVHVLLDRGFSFPVDVQSPEFMEAEKDDEYHIVQTLQEYRKFIDWHTQNRRMRHETVIPGSDTQIGLVYDPLRFPDCSVRIIAANGIVWSGYQSADVDTLFPKGRYPGENPLSVCLRISYGRFDYFTGGDISGIGPYGETDLHSMESVVAPVVGPVDVATLNHHGNRDSQNPYYVRTLRPRVWIGQTWSSDHPGHDVLRRISSRRLYPGPRDVFATDMLEANKLVIGDLVDRAYAADHGHIVVRVYEGGDAYRVYVLNDLSEKREIIRETGPYRSR